VDQRKTEESHRKVSLRKSSCGGRIGSRVDVSVRRLEHADAVEYCLLDEGDEAVVLDKKGISEVAVGSENVSKVDVESGDVVFGHDMDLLDIESPIIVISVFADINLLGKPADQSATAMLGVMYALLDELLHMGYDGFSRTIPDLRNVLVDEIARSRSFRWLRNIDIFRHWGIFV
jgi:hypothetical protein